eukprot:TRINITY_DN8173_c0_g2_i2.p2 TRINITY_DN8173_c0_g2~~TRINITY_DN8173_c0_g2_i2.p2  ORF type:complete len:660 (+),score=184.07 TRINITY_DN8173_c0_g2_i2:2447-4426(+)
MATDSLSMSLRPLPPAPGPGQLEGEVQGGVRTLDHDAPQGQRVAGRTQHGRLDGAGRREPGGGHRPLPPLIIAAVGIGENPGRRAQQFGQGLAAGGQVLGQGRVVQGGELRVAMAMPSELHPLGGQLLYLLRVHERRAGDALALVPGVDTPDLAGDHENGGAHAPLGQQGPGNVVKVLVRVVKGEHRGLGRGLGAQGLAQADHRVAPPGQGVQLGGETVGTPPELWQGGVFQARPNLVVHEHRRAAPGRPPPMPAGRKAGRPQPGRRGPPPTHRPSLWARTRAQSASVASSMASREQRSSTMARPCAPKRAANSGSSSTRATPPARAWALPGSTSRPVRPSMTTWPTSPASAATTGRSAAICCSAAWGTPSFLSLANTNTSHRGRMRSTSERMPVMTTRPPRPMSCTRPRISSSLGPPPTMRNCRSRPWSSRSWAMAKNRSCRFQERRMATMATTGAPGRSPSSRARSSSGGPGAQRFVSTPVGMDTTRSGGRPQSWTRKRRMPSPVVLTAEGRRQTKLKGWLGTLLDRCRVRTEATPAQRAAMPPTQPSTEEWVLSPSTRSRLSRRTRPAMAPRSQGPRMARGWKVRPSFWAAALSLPEGQPHRATRCPRAAMPAHSLRMRISWPPQPLDHSLCIIFSRFMLPLHTPRARPRQPIHNI